MSTASRTDAAHPATPIETIEPMVAALRAQFDSGATRPLDWRRAQLAGLLAMVGENVDELVGAIRADFAKPELEALASDLMAVTQEAKAAIKALPGWMKPRRVRTPLQVWPARSRIVSDPLGVVLIISPWNYPVQLLLSPLVGALAAGNCVVLKPSEVTPHTSAALARLIPRYLDERSVRVVEGAVPETTALLEQRFDHILYTGNGAVARVVMAAAARHLTPVTLELGGKSPCIVDASANLDVTARRIAWGKFINAGQTCIAPDYVLAEASIEPALVARLEQVVEDFYGPDPAQSPDYGRIVDIRHHRRIAGLLKDAGEVRLGGVLDEEDRYIAPTIVRRVDPHCDLMREEIFGPVLPVLIFEALDEAIEIVNERDKPLALYLFSERPEAEHAVLSRTSSGGVCINGTILHVANPHLPFGGVGPSGMGVYHGRSSFDTFSHRKSVLRRSTRFDLAALYPPYTRFKTNMIKKML